MVLQRDSTVTIWGWADAGEEVAVQGDWLDDSASTKANGDSRWQVKLKTGPAGGPHTISIDGKNPIKLDEILFGEVWIASGQSNMEMPLIPVSGAYTGIKDFEQEVREADDPEMRLFQADNFSSKDPLDDVEPGIEMYGIPPAACRWQACSPETVPTFSSTAYFFARELHRTVKVPIGIIDASWRGTPAEAWTPAEGLKRLGYDAALEQARISHRRQTKRFPLVYTTA